MKLDGDIENWNVGDRVVIAKDCPYNMEEFENKHGVIIGFRSLQGIVVLDDIKNPSDQEGWYTNLNYLIREVADNNRGNLQYMKKD